jgi:hypothetical protein
MYKHLCMYMQFLIICVLFSLCISMLHLIYPLPIHLHFCYLKIFTIAKIKDCNKNCDVFLLALMCEIDIFIYKNYKWNTVYEDQVL